MTALETPTTTLIKRLWAAVPAAERDKIMATIPSDERRILAEACVAMTAEEQARQLLDGYDYDDGQIAVPEGTSWKDMERIAEKHGITLYEPGEYHDEARVVVTDAVYAYAIGADGEPETIAG